MTDKVAHEEDRPEGAEAAEGVAEALEESGKLKRKKLLLIAVPVIFVLAGVGVYLSGALSGKKNSPESAAATAAAAEAPTFYNLPDQVVNLTTDKGKPVFLELSISLELTHPDDVKVIEKELPLITDNFQVYLRELHVDELKGSAGMYRLREELLMRVNNAVQPIQIKDVLFSKMLVQ